MEEKNIGVYESNDTKNSEHKNKGDKGCKNTRGDQNCKNGKNCR